MNWNNIYLQKRTGTETITGDARSEYQRDFDRLIFCPGFRRMQNKTQVFPLPGITFVHNRLTHSLEVASVGRSLGKIAGQIIINHSDLNDESKEFYTNDLQNVIAAACLAHDIGNPPFGHSGEKAISKYFIENADKIYEKNDKIKKPLKDFFKDNKLWMDLTNFEGNANGFRFLTHSFNNKVQGGLRLTYATLAATIKYPCESTGSVEGKKYLKKYNFFQSEKETFLKICDAINMEQESTSPIRYKRHPFAYLTEAADDICYNLIDVEDAVRLRIVPVHKVEKDFMSLIKCVSTQRKLLNNKVLKNIHRTTTIDELDKQYAPIYDLGKVESMKNSIKDDNERISYLRAKCINALIIICSDCFANYLYEIINGEYDQDLASPFMTHCEEMKAIKDLSNESIYNHDTVVRIELTGYKVLYELLDIFIPAVLKEKKDEKDEKILRIIPSQFHVEDYFDDYYKVMGVLDFISGMTDTYATQLYRDLHGIHIVKHT